MAKDQYDAESGGAAWSSQWPSGNGPLLTEHIVLHRDSEQLEFRRMQNVLLSAC